MTCKILGLLINTLAADEKYPVLNTNNLTIPIQMPITQKQKTFCRFLAKFLKSFLNFKHIQKNLTLIAFVFWKLWTPKTKLDNCLKSVGFRGPFNKQHGKRSKAPLKCASVNFYQIHWSLQSQLSWKKSLLLTCKILGLPVITLAADEKYPVLNTDNLTIPIQIQLSQKQKSFSQFLATCLKSSLNFEYLEKKMTLIDFVFSKLQTRKT